jgi:hypothetical protein
MVFLAFHHVLSGTVAATSSFQHLLHQGSLEVAKGSVHRPVLVNSCMVIPETCVNAPAIIFRNLGSLICLLVMICATEANR